MAFQLIFVVESDEESRSDYMYIRAVLDKCYGVLARKDIKITPVFMRGKAIIVKRGCSKQLIIIQNVIRLLEFVCYILF